MLKPIGCLGGTFNPPHTAHFLLAHAALEQLSLGACWLIPAAQPWQKTGVLPAAHRLEMLRHACADDYLNWQASAHTKAYPISVNQIEIDNTLSKTIHTLKALRLTHPETPLVWIMGSDQLCNLATWYEWQSLLDYAHIAVAQRANHTVKPNALPPPVRDFYLQHLTESSNWRNHLNGCFIPLNLPAAATSSSAIRAAIANGVHAADLTELHPSVSKYIHAHRFYIKDAS